MVVVVSAQWDKLRGYGGGGVVVAECDELRGYGGGGGGSEV